MERPPARPSPVDRRRITVTVHLIPLAGSLPVPIDRAIDLMDASFPKLRGGQRAKRAIDHLSATEVLASMRSTAIPPQTRNRCVGRRGDDNATPPPAPPPSSSARAFGAAGSGRF